MPWNLSEPEIKIVGLLYELDSNKAIANRLGVAVITVKTHLTNVFKKMGCGSRLQAAVKWEFHKRGIEL